MYPWSPVLRKLQLLNFCHDNYPAERIKLIMLKDLFHREFSAENFVKV